MRYDQVGKVLVVVGGVVLLLGLLFLIGGRGNSIGRLPGDINFTGGNFTCIVPIVSMLLLSLLLTIIVNVILRFFNR